MARVPACMKAEPDDGFSSASASSPSGNAGLRVKVEHNDDLNSNAVLHQSDKQTSCTLMDTSDASLKSEPDDAFDNTPRSQTDTHLFHGDLDCT